MGDKPPLDNLEDFIMWLQENFGVILQSEQMFLMMNLFEIAKKPDDFIMPDPIKIVFGNQADALIKALRG